MEIVVVEHGKFTIGRPWETDGCWRETELFFFAFCVFFFAMGVAQIFGNTELDGGIPHVSVRSGQSPSFLLGESSKEMSLFSITVTLPVCTYHTLQRSLIYRVC